MHELATHSFSTTCLPLDTVSQASAPWLGTCSPCHSTSVIGQQTQLWGSLPTLAVGLRVSEHSGGSLKGAASDSSHKPRWPEAAKPAVAAPPGISYAVGIRQQLGGLGVGW